MPDESDITIQAPEHGADTYTGGINADITPQENRAGRVKEELRSEIAQLQAEAATEQRTREEPGWASIIGRNDYTAPGAPDLSFLEDLAVTMGSRVSGGFDIGASAAGEKIASVITWIGNERTRLNNAIAGRVSANVQRSAIISQAPGFRGASGEEITSEEAAAAGELAYQTSYQAEKEARQAETARKYGIPVEEASGVVVYMGDWEGGPTAKWMYTGAVSPPGVPAEGLPGNPYDVGSWKLTEEPLPENPVASDIQELAGYLETINPKGKGDTYDVRAAAMNSGRRVATYKEKIRKKLQEGKYPEEYKSSVEDYLAGAETYETSIFQWSAAPSKQNYWAMKMQERSPELPPSLTWAISRAMFPEEGTPSTAATNIFQWATGERTTFGKNQAAPGGVDLATWAKETGQASPEGGIRGDLLPASFPDFVKEAAAKTENPGLTETKMTGWANLYTNQAVGVMGGAAGYKPAPSPTPPSPAEAEAAGILGVETLPKAGPHERASFDEYITAMPVRGAMKEIEWIKAGEAGWVNKINSGLGWIPGESAPKEFLRGLSNFGVGMIAGTGMAVIATGPLLVGSAEYFIREPVEAFGNIVPGLGMQAEQTGAAFEENPALTTGEIVGPFFLPYAVKQLSPITIGLTEIPTGREVPTIWSRLGIASRKFTPPWTRGFTVTGEGEVVSQGWGTGESIELFAQTKPEGSPYLYLMTKEPLSSPSEGGTIRMGIGKAINAASGESRVRPFLGHPTGLMESSTISIREGRLGEAGAAPWTRGESALMEPFKAAHATPVDITVSGFPKLADEAEAMNLPYKQAQPVGSIPHKAMSLEQEAGIQGTLSGTGKGAVQPGSRVAAAWMGEENFPRDVSTSDIDVDLSHRATAKAFQGIRDVMEATSTPVGKNAWEPSPGSSAEKVILTGGSHGGEPTMHLMEAGGTDTSRILGSSELESRPWISNAAKVMESTGGPVRGVGPAGMAKSYYSRTFARSSWTYTPEEGLAFNPNIGETKNIPDLAAMSRYMAKTAYEAPGDLTVDLAGVRAGRRAGLGVALEDFSNVFQREYGAEGAEHVRPGFKDTLLAGVNRETPGPSITGMISEATGRPSRTSGVADTMGMYGGLYEAGRTVGEYYGRGLPGEGGPTALPPAPRLPSEYPRGEESYSPPIMPTGYKRTLGEYPREPTYPKAPEYPKVPEGYPRESGYQRTFKGLYPREPTYPRTPEAVYPREPTYPRTPETPYPREPGYPRTPETPYPRNPPPPRVPRTPPPPPPPGLPGKERQERHPRPLEVIGYGEVVHPIVTGKYFLGLEGRKPLPRVREWHPTRARGDMGRAPGLGANLARSRATAPYVQVRGKPRWTEGMTLGGKVYKRSFWKRPPRV